MSTPGKIELVLKINTIPEKVMTVDNNISQFFVDCEGMLVSVKIKAKSYQKFLQATEQYPIWVATIRGEMGEKTEFGFVLKNAAIQVFEKKK
jgi:hypothetical protein